ncbi:MAG: hypothetical protein VR69_09190 [Peptococcaceae bacterium BRH_c4b]|nr:MAG: hypothetical protein VR69_09190 [Peptococcaceae bacterium BRH_c4b]
MTVRILVNRLILLFSMRYSLRFVTTGICSCVQKIITPAWQKIHFWEKVQINTRTNSKIFVTTCTIYCSRETKKPVRFDTARQNDYI